MAILASKPPIRRVGFAGGSINARMASNTTLMELLVAQQTGDWAT